MDNQPDSKSAGDRRHILASGFTSLDDALAASLAPDNLPLNKNTGRAWTVFDLGLSSLIKRASDLGLSPDQVAQVQAAAEKQLQKGLRLCESPIECMVLAALITAPWPKSLLTIPPIVHDARGNGDQELQPGDLVIVPQATLFRYRLDFCVIIEASAYQRLAVAIECDGAEFHADHAKEVKRDAYLHSLGVRVHHLTGSEIHRDAMNSIRPVLDATARFVGGAPSMTKQSALALSPSRAA